jgi:hypothetical protein
MRDTSGRLATVQCPHLIVFATLARLFTDLADVAALQIGRCLEHRDNVEQRAGDSVC